jgi:N-acyl-D-aspartate/D-glutamate deacylase
LRKMSLAPAQHLQRRVPSMRNKGRLRVGADADLVIFDPVTVIDRATYAEPLLPPSGIETVLVNGVRVVEDGVIRAGVYPGTAIRSPRQ